MINQTKTQQITKRKIVQKERVVRRKVKFSLIQDESGYPPFSEEFLWCKKITNAHFIVDSIPFFVREINLNDLIEAKNVNGELTFIKLLEQSGNKTVRIFCDNNFKLAEFTDKIKRMNISIEGSNIPSYKVFNIPMHFDVTVVYDLLKNYVGDDFEYDDE